MAAGVFCWLRDAGPWQPAGRECLAAPDWETRHGSRSKTGLREQGAASSEGGEEGRGGWRRAGASGERPAPAIPSAADERQTSIVVERAKAEEQRAAASGQRAERSAQHHHLLSARPRPHSHPTPVPPSPISARACSPPLCKPSNHQRRDGPSAATPDCHRAALRSPSGRSSCPTRG